MFMILILNLHFFQWCDIVYGFQKYGKKRTKKKTSMYRLGLSIHFYNGYKYQFEVSY